jgi:hypothetical protein
MDSFEQHNLTKESIHSKDPAPPIRPKKHIKYKIIHGPFKKNKTLVPQNKLLNKNSKQKETKIFGEFTPLSSNDDWSIFSPNFINNSKEDKLIQKSVNINENSSINREKFMNKLSKSVLNVSHSDNEKIIKLEKEINGLKETNQNILNLIMEKEKENRILINNIDKYKIESIENLSNYLNYIEELGKKFKFSNDDDDINLDITNDLNEINELNIELNKNKQLKKILDKKNEEFNEINESIQKLIFKDNSPLLNYSHLNISNNENKNIINNINEDKNEENENINIKNEYYKLKNDYNKLIEKYRQNEQKNKESKNRIKFVYKDIPQNQKSEYESKIKVLIEENQKIKNNYNKEIEKLNISIGSLKVEYLNNQFENETKLLNTKKKIKQLIKQCKNMGIKLNNEIINIK